MPKEDEAMIVKTVKMEPELWAEIEASMEILKSQGFEMNWSQWARTAFRRMVGNREELAS